MHRRLTQSADFVGDGRITADLYDLGHYPGIVLNPDSDATTVGELYELHAEDADALWQTLDVYEGCGEADARPHLYRRELVTVALTDGTTVEAWTYVLGRLPLTAVAVYGGDYLAWKTAAAV